MGRTPLNGPKAPPKPQPPKEPGQKKRGRPVKYALAGNGLPALTPLPPGPGLPVVPEAADEDFFGRLPVGLIDMTDCPPEDLYLLGNFNKDVLSGALPLMFSHDDPVPPPPADAVPEAEPVAPQTPDIEYPVFSQEPGDWQLLPPSEPASPQQPDDHAEEAIQKAEREWRLELEASQRAADTAEQATQVEQHAATEPLASEALELLVEAAATKAPVAEPLPQLATQAIPPAQEPPPPVVEVAKRAASPTSDSAPKRQKLLADEGEWIAKTKRTSEDDLKAKIATLSAALRLDMDKDRKSKKDKKRQKKQKAKNLDEKKKLLEQQQANLAAVAKQVAEMKARLAAATTAQ